MSANPNNMITELSDKNGVIYDIAAKKLDSARNVAITGDVAGSTTWDASGDLSVATALGSKVVGQSNIDDGAVGLTQIASNAMGGSVADNDSVLATHAAVKTYVDNQISGQGTYIGKKTVAEINALQTSDLHNGDRVMCSDAGTITLGPGGKSFDVVAGEDLILYKSGNTVQWDSMDGNFKLVQSPVADPSASGTSITFIDSISQDSNGNITPTKKTVANASASTSGVGGSAGLMTAADKEKLDGIAAGAEVNVQSDWSEANASSDAFIANKPTALSDFTDDITTDTYDSAGTAPASGQAIADALTGYKQVQTAISDPTVPTTGTTTALAFIDSISQDAQGVITPTKKTIPNAVASSSGTGGSAGLMTGADKEKLDGIEAGAEANVQSDWSQSSSTADDYIKNKPTALSAFTDDITAQTYVGAGTGSDAPISGAGVKDALDTLDATITGTAGAAKTAAVTQTNGVVSVTYSDIELSATYDSTNHRLTFNNIAFN